MNDWYFIYDRFLFTLHCEPNFCISDDNNNVMRRHLNTELVKLKGREIYSCILDYNRIYDGGKKKEEKKAR